MSSRQRIVTFLFTDIERSTRLWQEHARTMPDALALHDALAREAIERGAGTVFKHTGDGVCAAFEIAPAAVHAAITLQRRLAAASWGDGPRPRVRMALDSGPAHERGGDYFGQTLNRAARVLSVGSGGQILVTAATRALAPDSDAVDLGLHRLRDLGEPVRLHQVVADGLERTFPALKSLEGFRHSLPVVRSSFVGREAEVARVRALLESTRLLTVTGVGGCGKTRLALAVASQELDRFKDGVFFVDLSIVSDPGRVWDAVALGLGLAGDTLGALPPRDLVLGRLSDATALVVPDNCEHLLDASADVVVALLDGCPSIAVLSTSREPLGVEGEQVFRIPSLTLPAEDADPASAEAVRLFVERCTAADARFALTPDVTPAVVEICRRLDGIPLAIELAAARVRHLSPVEIASRLDDRFRLLTGGPRGARQRQQTLTAALDWSYQLLTERERTLLRRAAVFVDGFSLAAIEGVCAGGGLAAAEVVDVLGALVDKSLVSLHPAEGRYRLLETIRLYALDRLVEAGEAPAMRTAHLAWYRRMYDTLPEGPIALEMEVENLRAARAWAHETGDGAGIARLTVTLFWQGRFFAPMVTDERAWCQSALACEDLAPGLRADLLVATSFRDVGVGDWDAAIVHARQAIDVAPAPGEGIVPGAYLALATGLMVTDPDAAERAIDEGIARVRGARRSEFSEADLASAKVGTALMRGDLAGVLAVGRELGGYGTAMHDARSGVAVALHLSGDHAGAEAEVAAGAADQWAGGIRGHSDGLLGVLTAAAQGRWDDAGRRLAAAAAHVRRYPYPLMLNDCVVVCGALAALDGRLERACELLAAVVDRSSVRTPQAWAVYLHYRDVVRARLDRDTIRRCREAARSIDLDRALDEELARYSARS